MQPTIGISSGDPSGIGLEVILKAIPKVAQSARWILYTDASAFDRHYLRFGSGFPYQWIKEPDEATDNSALHLIEVPGATCPIPWGDIQEGAGERAIAYLKAAGDAALQRKVSAIVTAPVHKAAIGRSFKGQTDFLADQARSTRFAMAFFTPTF